MKCTGFHLDWTGTLKEQTVLELRPTTMVKASQRSLATSQFPDGLSEFGIRCFNGERNLDLARELCLDEIRRREFPELPSRFQAFFSVPDRIAIRDLRNRGLAGSVWKVTSAACFEADMQLLDHGRLNDYWQTQGLVPRLEYLMRLPVTVVRQVPDGDDYGKSSRRHPEWPARRD